MLLYERFVSPLGRVIQTRGFGRFEGLYADVMSYAIYMIGAFCIACFLFLDESNRDTFNARARKLTLIGGLVVAGLISMHHTSSWGVAAALVALAVWHILGRRSLPAFVLVLLVGGAVALTVGETIGERISTALQTDIAVIQGEKDTRYAFHGRMWRWQMHLEEWSEISLPAKLLGVPVAAPDGWWGGMLTGVHNDYLRVLFASGWLGLITYLSFYVLLYYKTLNKPKSDQFLIRSGIVVMMLYSITTVPTLYAPLLYLALSIFAYAALPQRESQRLTAMNVRYVRLMNSARM